MYTLRQWLAIILLGLYTTSTYAQLNISVDIQGISGVLADNARLFLSIEQQKNNTLLSEGRLQRLHNKATQEITRALQPFGYYRPVIHGSLNKNSEENWIAAYHIDPGPALPIVEVNFTLTGPIETDPEFQDFKKNLPLHKGDTLNHRLYDSIKNDLAKLAVERGYFNAHFVEHRIDINLERYQAHIHLHYDSGPRYRFGEIRLEQNILTSGLLHRYIPFERGDPYSLNKLLDLQQSLNDSDYFQSVEVSPMQPDANSNEVPVNIALTPRKHHRFSLGLGYGTDTGARTKVGWEVPRVNRRGHRFNTEARLTEVGFSVRAHYRVPVLNPRTDQIIYSSGVINEKTDTSDSTVRTIGASLNRSRAAWRESVSITYQQEKFVVGNDRGQSLLIMPGANWSRTWGRNFIYTLDGLRFDIGLRGASQQLASDTSFAQLQGGIKAITPLGSRNRIITHGRLGGTWTQAFHQLPSSVRFFAGGSQSVRGYSYQSLGPVDGSGVIVGGKNLMVGSIELEHSLSDKWGVAAFYDAGNAIDNIDDKLERGAGIGWRWRSPIGPVRFDLASAISRDGRPWRLHINIGPDL